MSRVRTRPTRDETCDKLFEAAARVFEEQGIGSASIEAIAAAAGFSRGAFYSNFKSKDELIIAMLEDHVERSIERNLDLFGAALAAGATAGVAAHAIATGVHQVRARRALPVVDSPTSSPPENPS